MPAKSISLKTISRFTAFALATMASFSAAAATYTVGAGKTFATPAQINWSQVKPGDTIAIYPGTYTSMGTGNSMTLSGVKGTATQPITITAYSTTSLPVLSEGINIANNSQYVVVQYLNVTRAPSTTLGAVVVQSGSSDITLSHLKVYNSYVGVNVATAGLRNHIAYSEIYGSTEDGIAVSLGNATPDQNNMSHITGNSVHDNGAHGMEISDSYWRIENNVVSHNGLSVVGTSGIHLFTYSDTNGVNCSHNQVYYNYATGQKDNQTADGNGIQSDNFCNNNTIAFNVVWNNDGAGISQIDGKGNIIVANTTYKNARDTHRISLGADRGEIILGSWTNICSNPYADPNSCNIAAGRSSGNVIYDNLVYSDQATVAGIHTTADYVDPTRNTSYFYPNLYYNAANGINLHWGNVAYSTGRSIDAVTGLQAMGGGNLVELPTFVNPAIPYNGNGIYGLSLSKQPSNAGWVIAPTVPDILNVMPTAGVSYYGAYYTKP